MPQLTQALRPTQFELEQVKKRLSFYELRREQAISAGTEVPKLVLKWIDIYSERCKKIQAVLSAGMAAPAPKAKSRKSLH